MPLVRATQQTALPTVRQLIGELKKLARDTASAPALDNLALNLDGLDAYGGRKSLDVELILTGPLAAEEAERVAAWVGQGFPSSKLQMGPGDLPVVEIPGPPLDLRVVVRHLSGRFSQKAGAPRAPIVVLVLARELTLSEDDRGALDRVFDDRPQVVLLGSTKKAPPLIPAVPPTPPAGDTTAPLDGAPPAEAAAAPDAPAADAPPAVPGPPEELWFKDLETKAKAAAWSCLTHKHLPDMTLQARLGTAPWDGLHDLFRAHGLVVGLDALSSVYDMVMDQVQGELKVNKSVAQQKLTKFGGAKGTAAPPSAAADMLADLKNRTQRLAAEFERGAADRLQDLLGQPAGLLVRETEQALGGLQELQLEAKTKTMGARVPASFEEKINKLIRERVGRHCAGDLVALNDLFRLIGQEFDRSLAQVSGPPIVVQFRYLTDERVRRMLDMYGIFQSPFKAEMPNPGFGEYFASVRKYSMILVMGASMFGMSAMLRTYREITVPITVLLVAFGTYSVATGTRQQRVENLEMQLEAARAAMRTEIRRIITDLQKQWSAMLKEFLNDQISGAVAEVDAALKEASGKKGAGDVNPERDRITRALTAMEASEKRIAASVKVREAFVQSLVQVKGDLKGLMAGGGPPGMARPGMPGPGGMPPRPGMPAMPPRPGMPGAPALPARPAAAPNPGMAEARAKLAAAQAARANPAAPAAAAPAAGGGAAADFRARMAAMKAKPAGAEAPAAAPAPAAAAAPAAATEAAPASAPAEPKVSAADAFKAKMAAMKAAKAGGPPATAAAPAEPAVVPEAPAAPPPAPAAAPRLPPRLRRRPAPAAAPAPAPAAPAAAEPKLSAADAFKAKMAAMKAAKAAPAAAAESAPAAASAAAPPAEPAAAVAAPPAEAPAAPVAAPPAEPKLSAADAFKAKMAAMKAAKAAPAAAASPAAAAVAPTEAPAAAPPPAAAEPAPPPAAAEPASPPPPPEAAPAAPAAPPPATEEHHFAETMEIPSLPEVNGPERAE